MGSHFFTSRDGLRLHWLRHPCLDPHSKSVCVLLHGFTNDAHVWDAIAAELQQSHEVLALDHRGHGDSDWDPECKYSHWQLADDLQDFLQEIVPQVVLQGASQGTSHECTVHVVGHSLGARVALLALAAVTRPIASLTIIDAGPEVNPDAGDRLVADVLQMPASYADVQAYRDCLARTYVMADPRALDHVAQFGLRVRQGRLVSKTDPAFTPGIWHKTPELQALHRQRGTLGEQLWQALRSLELPVHLMRGQASSILEAGLAARMMQELGSKAELSLVPRAGHAVMLDNPAASRQLLVRFIDGLGSTADAWRTAV